MRRGPLQSNETEEEVKQRQMKAELFKAQTKVNQINEKQNGWKKAFAEKKLVHKCSICMEFMSEPVKLPCGHYFCLDCLKMQQQMLSYSHMRECALCRKKAVHCLLKFNDLYFSILFHNFESFLNWRNQ